MTDTPETRAMLAAGKLSQRCPRCGLVEAAGFTCTWDAMPTGPADWFAPVASPARRAALAAGRATRRRDAERRSPLAKSAERGL